MVMSALNTFIGNVDWGLLDVLVIDMPPGTGALSLESALSGAISSSDQQAECHFIAGLFSNAIVLFTTLSTSSFKHVLRMIMVQSQCIASKQQDKSHWPVIACALSEDQLDAIHDVCYLDQDPLSGRLFPVTGEDKI